MHFLSLFCAIEFLSVGAAKIDFYVNHGYNFSDTRVKRNEIRSCLHEGDFDLGTRPNILNSFTKETLMKRRNRHGPDCGVDPLL